MKKINQAKMLSSRVELDYLLAHPEDQNFQDGLLEPDSISRTEIVGSLLSWLNRAGGYEKQPSQIRSQLFCITIRLCSRGRQAPQEV